MKNSLVALLLCMVSPMLCAAPELKGSPAELSAYLLDARKIISINGVGEEKVEADQVIVNVTIKNEARSLDGAIEENEQIQSRVKQALLAGGVTADMIKADNFSSTPDYGWLRDKPKSYEISRDIKVTINNAIHMRAIARVVDNFDEVFMGALTFEDSVKRDNELKVMQQALEHVQEKKVLYEKSFAIKLGLVKVSEQPVYASAPVRKHFMRNEAQVSSMMKAEPAMEAGSGGSFARIVYHANVTALFEIVK